MNVDLDKLDLRQLVIMGDAALRAGERITAQRFYSEILRRSPLASHVHARLWLAAFPGERSLRALNALAELEQLPSAAAFIGEGIATWRKTMPFIEDQRFMELAQRHVGLLPVRGWHWNLQTVVWAVEQVRALEGDFVELGVFKGHTTLFVSEYLGFADWPKTWWLYDTFEGIPADQMDPGWATDNAKVYNSTIFTFEEVTARFAHIPNIKVIKGRVPEILDQGAPERIAFLHMDLNNAAAEIQALDKLFDRIVPGGVIVFDDYLWVTARAQYEAEKAWFAERGLVILPIPTGQGVFVKR